MYISLGFILLLVIVYMNGYRWSLDQLNSEINQIYHFNQHRSLFQRVLMIKRLSYQRTMIGSYVDSINKSWVFYGDSKV